MFRYLGLAVATLLWTGCRACPVAGCGPAVDIDIDISGGERPLDPTQAYSIDLVLDGQTFTAECPASARCSVTPLSGDFRVSTFRDVGIISLYIHSGDELAPDSIELQVRVDSEVLLEESFTPEYSDSEDHCGVCRDAEESYVVYL